MKENVNLIDFIQQHLRETLGLLFFMVCFIWQSPAAIIGLILFLILIRGMGLSRWLINILGCVVAVMAIAFQGNTAILI